ncbi:hypothetical protein F4553_005943 [Allocatelliglobosispora scoriae]|uniref:DUF4173 domain-containing protein n=1 Tax=Allocatelliglobosispora scoriae TaxID=643052 RepID=A0A841BZI5_9ACTN|nr:DUF4153 domain-containing protein [Allocatelliglobosispora scoriae]MBB5872509.1 hypothetical protein [Allocatelliglobosispora scoriae]
MTLVPVEASPTSARHRAIEAPPAPAPRAPSIGVTLAIVVSIVAAMLIGREPGIGTIIAQIVCFAGLLTVGVWQLPRTEDRMERLRDLRMWLLATVSIAFTVIGSQRDAGWVVAVCFVAALLTGSMALAGGSAFAGVLHGSVATWIAGVRQWPWFLRGIAAAWRRALQGSGFAVQMGSLIAAGIAAIALVAAMAIGAVDPVRLLIALVVGTLTIGGMFVLATRPRVNPQWTVHRGLRTPFWVVPVALLDLVVLAHAVIYVGGIVRLVVLVGVATVAIALVATFAPRDTTAQQMTLRLVLGPLCIGVLLHVGVAFGTILDQLDTNGLTRARLAAMAVIVFVGLAYALIVLAGITMRALWLPRAIYGAAIAVVLGFALINPDATIAQTDIDRHVRPELLSSLSADAVDALDELPEPDRSCALREIQADLAEPDGWFAYSHGRAHAREVLAARPINSAVTC